MKGLMSVVWAIILLAHIGMLIYSLFKGNINMIRYSIVMVVLSIFTFFGLVED